jgi:hypothetical protein
VCPSRDGGESERWRVGGEVEQGDGAGVHRDGEGAEQEFAARGGGGVEIGLALCDAEDGAGEGVSGGDREFEAADGEEGGAAGLAGGGVVGEEGGDAGGVVGLEEVADARVRLFWAPGFSAAVVPPIGAGDGQTQGAAAAPRE